MSSSAGVRLDSLPEEEIKNWISSYDNVLTDCDGVIWLHSDVIGQADKVMNRFKEMGKGIFFVTNNSTKTRPEFLEKAVSMNFNIGAEEIISPSYMAAQYLHTQGFDKEVYVIGSNGIAKELDAVGIPNHGVGPDEMQSGLAAFVHDELKLNPNIGAVVVGFDEYFNFKKLTKACSYLERPGCLFIATNTDERFPTPDCIIPGTGAIVAAVQTAAERKPMIMGKPYSFARDILMKTHSIDPERTLMIGDRCNTDILFGKNCGFKTLLVETGIHNEADVRQWQNSDDEDLKRQVPDFILSSLTDLLKYMED